MIASTSPKELAQPAKFTCEKIEPGILVEFIDNAREDSLTAAVISHLLHLPSEMFWLIFRRACYTKYLPAYPGEPKQLNVRPNWNPAQTSNSDRVIPDIFIRFDDFDLIIEAKLKDYGTQCPKQWERELIAYTNEYGKKRSVRMIALGGILCGEDYTLTQEGVSCPVHMCQWFTVLLECERLKRDLEDDENPSSRTCADLRILKDLIAFFAAHGYPSLRWFADFKFKPNLLDDGWVDFDHKYFRKISHQFQ